MNPQLLKDRATKLVNQADFAEAARPQGQRVQRRDDAAVELTHRL